MSVGRAGNNDNPGLCRRFTAASVAGAALFVVLCSVLGGCTDRNGTNVERGSREGILYIGNHAEPQDLDPHIITGIPESRLVRSLLEGLVSRNPRDLTPVPGVASSWDIAADNRSYTFYLRPDARWSNGAPVTAQDFVWSWRRALSPALGNEYAYMLYVLENARDYHQARITDFARVGVRASDEKTLVVTLAQVTPYFLQLLDHHSFYPLHPATILKFGRADERGTRWTRAENFVGNGPFQLVEWRMNRVIRVRRNPYYWDHDNISLNEIRFYPVENVATEERMFRTGQLHVTNDLPAEKIARYQQLTPETLYLGPYLGTYFYRLNTAMKPLDDVRVRRALSLTIDRSAIVHAVTKAGETEANSYTPPGTAGYFPSTTLEHNPALGQQLLAEAGYPGGREFPKLTLSYNTLETHRKIAVAIQQMWKQALGITIELENQDWKVFLDNQKNMRYQISRASWIGDYLDPNTFLDMYVTAGGNNRTGWSNPEYDALIARAAQTTDAHLRYAIFDRAETILLQELPIIPIYTYTRKYLKSTDVNGWYPNILDQHPYKYVSLQPN